jgi:ABC-type lipoprotein release transport system permease subunit
MILAANILNLPKNTTQGIRVKTNDLFHANSIGFNLLAQPFLNEDHYYLLLGNRPMEHYFKLSN